MLVGYYVYTDPVFEGKERMDLPEDLWIVQEKVPTVKVHHKVYIALVVAMLVYMLIGKFIIQFVSLVY